MSAAFISYLLLAQARMFAERKDWRQAHQAASEALGFNPALVDAYLLRGFCGRKLGRFQAALADYDRAIELDAQRGHAWVDRGAVKVLIAYELDDPLQPRTLPPPGGYRKYCAEAEQWLERAYSDYQRGAELDPDDPSAGLSLLELEIILDRHKQAVARAAEWWNNLQEPDRRLPCAWMAALAFILAGKKQQHWLRFRQYLETNPTAPAWEPEQIDGYLARLRREGKHPASRLAEAEQVHAIFLSRYRVDGEEAR